MDMAKTKVLIIDDSALVRKVLTGLLAQDPSIEVVGAASDPYAAWEKIRALQPDVLTLDVEMPRMDGLTFLDKLMRAHPMPVLMISSLTERGCETTLRALELGAVDFVTKPKLDVERGTGRLATEIVAKVKMAAASRPRRRTELPASAPGKLAPLSGLAKTTHKIIAVGASTGGTEALREFLVALPPDAPGIVIVQHMPAGFTRAFASRLDSLCKIRVAEARDGDRVLPGHALVAPGDFQLEVLRSGVVVSVRVFPGEPVNRHRPSVDVLFHSCAKVLGHNAVGVIMTGMGADGARGLLAMRQAGARTVAQDEASCVVFGMPKEAIAMGAAEEIAPLSHISSAALRFAAA
jgi:two-component system, chemotaxis family, protein-glutamate methylesterase/glutaminase